MVELLKTINDFKDPETAIKLIKESNIPLRFLEEIQEYWFNQWNFVSGDNKAKKIYRVVSEEIRVAIAFHDSIIVFSKQVDAISHKKKLNYPDESSCSPPPEDDKIMSMVRITVPDSLKS